MKTPRDVKNDENEKNLVKDGTPHTYLASVKKVPKSTMHCEYCGLPIIENGGQIIVTIRSHKWHQGCIYTYVQEQGLL